MKSNKNNPRIIDPELMKRLDPTEQIIANKFIQDGRWQVKEEIKTN